MEKKFRSPKLTRIEKLTRGLLKGNNADMFAIKEVAGKGRGVFLKASLIRKDSFVLEYEGDIISEAEAVKREHFYESNGEGCYILYFKFKGTKMALDATRRYDSFTRLLNHSRKPNIRFHHPIVIDLNIGFPRIAAYALCDIHQGQEIVFDYGVQDGNISWLKNSEAGFVSDVDSDSSCDAKEDLQVTCKISPVRPFNTDSKTIKKNNSTGEFAYAFTNLLPQGYKKRFCALYQSFGVPEMIIRLPDDSPKKSKVLEKFVHLEETSLPHRMNASVSSRSDRTPCVELPCKAEPDSIDKVNEWLSHESFNYYSPVQKTQQNNQPGAACKSLQPPVNLDDINNLAVTVDSSESGHTKNSTSVCSLTNDFVVTADSSKSGSRKGSLSSPRSFSLDKAAAQKLSFEAGTDITKGRDVMFCELSEDFEKEESLKFMAENESSLSKCEGILPEVTNSFTQSGMLARNLLDHGSVKLSSASPQVAVIRPFINTVIVPDAEPSHFGNLPDITAGAQKVSATITVTEREHLRILFHEHTTLDTASFNNIEDTILRNKDFFTALANRGVALDQIRSTIKEFFQDLDFLSSAVL